MSENFFFPTTAACERACLAVCARSYLEGPNHHTFPLTTDHMLPAQATSLATIAVTNGEVAVRSPHIGERERERKKKKQFTICIVEAERLQI